MAMAIRCSLGDWSHPVDPPPLHILVKCILERRQRYENAREENLRALQLFHEKNKLVADMRYELSLCSDQQERQMWAEELQRVLAQRDILYERHETSRIEDAEASVSYNQIMVGARTAIERTDVDVLVRMSHEQSLVLGPVIRDVRSMKTYDTTEWHQWDYILQRLEILQLHF